MKLLSVLIPAYQYPEGVDRILSIFSSAPPDQVEIIISDDSADAGVQIVVTGFQETHPGLAVYVRNTPPLGAAQNWNNLLNMATGKYILLMHHDEFPLGKNWAYELLAQLSKNRCTDIILIPCLLISESSMSARIHLPYLIQALTLKYFPSYLFRRNVIGAVSCLVIRKDIYPRFDESLRWLIDVDMYWNLFSGGANFKISKNLKIASIVNRSSSITTALSKNLVDIRYKELSYLSQKYPHNAIWLTPRTHRITFFIESCCWGVFKLVYVVYSFILGLFKSKRGKPFSDVGNI